MTGPARVCTIPGPWAARGSCATTATGYPWTTDTWLVPPVLVDLMADTCAACPVLTQCDTYAEAEAVTGGFWAGRDRATEELATEMRRAAA